MNSNEPIYCPVCLAHLPENSAVCPGAGCDFRVPSGFRERLRSAPPLRIAAVGLAGHAKTHLEAALALTLEGLDRQLPGFAFEPVDEVTRQRMQDWRKARIDERTLDRTPSSRGRSHPLILGMTGPLGRRTLMIYDVAGEHFQNLEVAHEMLPVLPYIRTVWFVVSPTDLVLRKQDPEVESRNEAQRGFDLSGLFAAYSASMSRLRAPLAGRQAVVVFTKGDLMADDVRVMEHLDSDPVGADRPPLPADFRSVWRREMAGMSDHLDRYNGARVERGSAFATLIREGGMDLRYCVTAPLGHDVGVDPTMAGPWRCARVLTPLLWTLDLETRVEEAGVLHLVVDAGGAPGEEVPAAPGGPLPQVLWRQLKDRYRVRLWQLGRGLAFPPDQPPPEPPSVPLPRLIGPLLPALGAEGPVVVVTGGVIWDLGDYGRAEWTRRLLVVNTGGSPEARTPWTRRVDYAGPSQLKDVLQAVSGLS